METKKKKMNEAGRTRIFNRIKKSNAAFKKMKVAGKRVAIAKDVIALLKTGQLNVASSNGYFDWDSYNVDEDAQAQDEFKTQSCTVCAIGAVFYADICRTNELTVEAAAATSDYGMVNRTMKIFSSNQMRLMEKAFEVRSIVSGGNEAYGNAEEFGSKYRDDDKRLIAIMKNIIKNKGTFKP